jgi:hypothetical protein
MTFMRRLFGDALGETSGASDDQLLAKLTATGADPGVPRPIDFLISFADERSARQTVAVLAGLAGDLRIGVSGGFNPRWVIRLTLTMALTLERLTALRAQFEQIAAERGGRYEGWEASGA